MNRCSSGNSTKKKYGLYGCPFARKILHYRPVVYVMAKVLGPRICGYLIGHLLLPYVDPQRINVLAVSRELLAKDIEQIESRTEIRFIPWRSGHLGRLMEAWTPRECQIQTIFMRDGQYHNHLCWTKGVELLRALHGVLEKKGSVPVAITANLDYWQEEPLRRFCIESGVKHLVLDRENHVVQEYRDNMFRVFQQAGFRFEGHVAVFSQWMKELIVETEACDPEQITVTGAPRMDIWLDQRPAPEKDTVTLLPFKTSLVDGMFDDALDTYIDAARNHPDLQFVIKCKEGRGDFGRMKEKFSASNAPSNVRAEQHVNMRDLMDRSRVIIGFNTLSLAEALLTDATLIIPSWKVTGDTKHLVMMDPDDVELGKEILFPRSLQQFRDQLQEALTGRRVTDRAARLKLTNRYMMFTPGQTASERVAALIEKLAGEKV